HPLKGFAPNAAFPPCPSTSAGKALGILTRNFLWSSTHLNLVNKTPSSGMKMDVPKAPWTVRQLTASTPPLSASSALFQGGVEPPQSKVLRTFSYTVAS